MYVSESLRLHGDCDDVGLIALFADQQNEGVAVQELEVDDLALIY